MNLVITESFDVIAEYEALGFDTEGVWDSSIPAIVIKRSKLSSLVGYAATLLHETGHATTGTHDATREFESVLTTYLGRTATAAVGA
jgi:hypothetical protein